MGAAVQLRDDYDGPLLRTLAKRSRNCAQARRLLALAQIYDGAKRSDAARLAGVGLQITHAMGEHLKLIGAEVAAVPTPF